MKNIIDYLLLNGFEQDSLLNDIYKGKTTYDFLVKPYMNGKIKVELEVRSENSIVLTFYTYPDVGLNHVGHFVTYGETNVITQLEKYILNIENEFNLKGIT